MPAEALEVELGQVLEGEFHLTGRLVQVDGPRQLHVQREAVEGDEDPVAFARQRLAQVHGARQQAREGGAFDLEDADLRAVGALRFLARPEVGLRRGAGALAVGGVGVDVEAGRQRTVRSRIAEGVSEPGLSFWGTVRLMSSPEGESASVVVGFALRLGSKLS